PQPAGHLARARRRPPAVQRGRARGVVVRGPDHGRPGPGRRRRAGVGLPGGGRGGEGRPPRGPGPAGASPGRPPPPPARPPAAPAARPSRGRGGAWRPSAGPPPPGGSARPPSGAAPAAVQPSPAWRSTAVPALSSLRPLGRAVRIVCALLALAGVLGTALGG